MSIILFFCKLNCPQSGCRSALARRLLFSYPEGDAQRQRVSPCRCTFIGVESRGCQIKYTMRLNGGSCLPCTKIIAQNAASENRKCKSVDKTCKNADFRLIERPIYIVCKNRKCYSFFENFFELGAAGRPQAAFSPAIVFGVVQCGCL